MRLAIIDDVAKHPGSSTQEVRRRLDKPRLTVDRQLQALHMLGVLTCEEVEYGPNDKVRWYYTLAADIDPDALDPESCPEKLVGGCKGERKSEESESEASTEHTSTHFSGQHGDPSSNGYPVCDICATTLERPDSISRGRCAECHLIHPCGPARIAVAEDGTP